MRQGMAGALLSAALVAPSSAAMAHHSFAMFDRDQQIELEGTVREFRFSARIFLDKTNRDILHNEITTIDHALTRPWTVTQDYRRERKTIWVETICAEDNRQVRIGKGAKRSAGR